MFNLFEGLDAAHLDRPDGTSLAMLTSAGEGAGTVICLHGFTGAKEDYVLLLPELSRQGWTAVAPDLRGSYESTSPGPFDLDTTAADIVALAGEQQGPVHLVGHSFGGLVAQRAVIADPEVFASLSLVCSGPAGLNAHAETVPITLDRIGKFRELLATHDLEQAWDAKTAYENIDMPDMMANFLRQRFVSGSHEAALANIDDLLDAPDVIDQVVATKVPASVMYGEFDGTWNQQTQNDMAERLGTTAHVIAAATHVPMLENVEDTADTLLAFLAATTEEPGA